MGKIKVSEIDRIIRELVAKKITEAKEIIKHLKEKLIELATNFKCTDVLSKKMCDEVHDLLRRSRSLPKKLMKSSRRSLLQELQRLKRSSRKSSSISSLIIEERSENVTR